MVLFLQNLLKKWRQHPSSPQSCHSPSLQWKKVQFLVQLFKQVHSTITHTHTHARPGPVLSSIIRLNFLFFPTGNATKNASRVSLKCFMFTIFLVFTSVNIAFFCPFITPRVLFSNTQCSQNRKPGQSQTNIDVSRKNIQIEA